MEAQQPKWREEKDEPYTSETEYYPISRAESTPDRLLEVDETQIIADGIRSKAQQGTEKVSETRFARGITEKELEMRREIQDDPGEQGKAISVGEILSGLQVGAKTQNTESRTSADSTLTTVRVDKTEEGQKYKKQKTQDIGLVNRSISNARSIWVGFFLAVILIVVFIMIKVLVSIY